MATSSTDSPPPDGPTLRVLLIGNYLRDGQESMQRFAEAMLAGLQRRGVDVQLIRPAAWLGRLGASSQAGLGKWLGYLDKLVLFPWRLRSELRRARRSAASAGASLVVHICDHSNAFYSRNLREVTHLVTCHDLLAVRSARGEIPRNPTRWSGKLLQSLILGGLNRAQRVACVSHATERDLLRLSTLRPGQVEVIGNSLNHAYAPMPDADARARVEDCFRTRRAAAPGEGFILHVGGNQWYKNRLGVLRIYARFAAAAAEPPPLVLAGEPLSAEMESFLREARLQDKIFRVQSCSHEELRALYSLAGALLFPSLAEGFGWPVIEAQACGCPVVCSSVDPFPEVAGTGACKCDPADEQGFANVLQRMRHDSEFRAGLIARGLANAGRFGPEVMISKYLQCYAALAKSAATARDVAAGCVASPLPV